MMLNKGRHGREQILSRASVELMTSDHLTPEQRAARLYRAGKAAVSREVAAILDRLEERPGWKMVGFQ
jgi:hypothetical protein